MTEFAPCPAFNIECQYVTEVDRLSAENERLREALEKIYEELSMCAADDCENGVRSLNERAAASYLEEYPHTAAAIKLAINTARAALGDTK